MDPGDGPLRAIEPSITDHPDTMDIDEPIRTTTPDATSLTEDSPTTNRPFLYLDSPGFNPYTYLSQLESCTDLTDDQIQKLTLAERIISDPHHNPFSHLPASTPNGMILKRPSAGTSGKAKKVRKAEDAEKAEKKFNELFRDPIALKGELARQMVSATNVQETGNFYYRGEVCDLMPSIRAWYREHRLQSPHPDAHDKQSIHLAIFFHHALTDHIIQYCYGFSGAPHETWKTQLSWMYSRQTQTQHHMVQTVEGLVRNVVRLTGGDITKDESEFWDTYTTSGDRRALFEFFFDQYPLQICYHVFGKLCVYVDFERIWSVSADTPDIPFWRWFSKNQILDLCESTYLHLVRVGAGGDMNVVHREWRESPANLLKKWYAANTKPPNNVTYRWEAVPTGKLGTMGGKRHRICLSFENPSQAITSATTPLAPVPDATGVRPQSGQKITPSKKNKKKRGVSVEDAGSFDTKKPKNKTKAKYDHMIGLQPEQAYNTEEMDALYLDGGGRGTVTVTSYDGSPKKYIRIDKVFRSLYDDLTERAEAEEDIIQARGGSDNVMIISVDNGEDFKDGSAPKRIRVSDELRREYEELTKWAERAQNLAPRPQLPRIE